MDFWRATAGCLTLLAPLLLAATLSASDQPVSDEMPMPPPGGEGATLVRGVVTDLGGRPLAEAGLAVTAGTSPVPDMLWLAGDDGGYVISLPAGTFSISANHDGYLQQVKEVTVAEGATAELNFQLAPAP